MSYSEYHARMWAESKTADEIREEIIRCELPHNYQWNQVGNAQMTYDRIDTLKQILKEIVDLEDLTTG